MQTTPPPLQRPDLSGRFVSWLTALDPERRRALRQQATERARARGLVVLRESGDVDIPLALSPEVAPVALLEERAADARAVLDGVVAAARHLLGTGVESPRAQLLFGHFGPLERECLALWQEASTVTIARVDWFLDAAGRHHALELNATIPAMQAYSDAAAAAFIETIGAAAGLADDEVRALIARNGSNAEALRRSIVARSGRPSEARPSLAVLHRPNDSQLRELQALGRIWSEAGHRVRLATPDELTVDADGNVQVGGASHDILFRHIFARRMDADSALAQVARGGARQRLQNPINGQLEVKGLFGELSRMLDEGLAAQLRLDAATQERLQRVMPWTRLLEPGRASGPGGAPIDDLIGWVRGHAARLVLKRSWDYGGKSVFIGRDVLASEGAAGWQARVDEALTAGPGAFVVQELVDAPRRRHWVPDGAGEPVLEPVFVDASTYAATGDRDIPGGSVVRYARVGIVNIVGGGGVSPLLRDDVARRLLEALGA